MTAQSRFTICVGLVGVSAAALLLLGCQSNARMHDRISGDHPALYPVCCADLESVMAKIGKSYRRAHRLPIRQMRNRNFAVLEDCARTLAEHARTVTASADLTPAGANDAALFDRLASQLESTAEALSAAAADKDRKRTGDLFARLTSTCNSCHAAFRAPHGALHDGDS